MSIGEVKATVRQAIQAIEEARTTIIEADDAITSATTLAAQTVHDSQDRDLEAGLKALSKATYEVQLTIRRLDSAATNANAYLDVVK